MFSLDGSSNFIEIYKTHMLIFRLDEHPNQWILTWWWKGRGGGSPEMAGRRTGRAQGKRGSGCRRWLRGNCFHIMWKQTWRYWPGKWEAQAMGTRAWEAEGNSSAGAALRGAFGPHRTWTRCRPAATSSPLRGGGEECTIASATTDAIVHQLLEWAKERRNSQRMAKNPSC